MKDGRKSYRRIGAVVKTIQILRYLAEQRGPVSGADAARALELPVGTVMCHLVTLEDDRLVRRIGEHWELGDGMAIFWARRKANLEAGIERMKDDLRDIGVTRAEAQG
ncbi:MAG: helix-turn-helix domain-containing protein [Deltaproteobacteria bacterium]|nr:helix-turn-helix domain-containing protein [Deltaproteobacteria bacterium]